MRALRAMLAAAVVALVLAAAGGLASCNSSGGAPTSCAFLPGDLVITEIMADPDGADAGKEWFELYNATAAELDLSGLSIELVTGRGSKVHMIRAASAPKIAAKGYLALGDGVVGDNGIAYSYGTAIGSLPNEAGTLIIRCGNSEIDRVDYGQGVAGPGAPSSGKSLQLTGTQTPEYHVNDVPESWCDATELMADGVDYGTPGAQNTPCASSGCDDGLGGFRPLRLAGPGELVLTEILSNAPGTEDQNKEWVEVFNPGTLPLDLLGVELLYGATCQTATAIAGDGCITVPANGYLVIAGDRDSSLNGGVSAGASFGGSGLLNDGGCVALRIKADQTVIDQATYGQSTDGHAFSLDPTKLDATQNDVQANWCEATMSYGTAGGFGTPGAANTPCGAAGCDDGAGGVRPLRPPAAGELVITEVMSNSPGTEDHAKEWFEVYNTTAEAIDLTGVEVLYGGTCQSSTDVVGTGCITIPPAGYAVIAGSADTAANGGVTALATFAGTGLINDNGCVALRVKSTQVLVDQVTYGSSTDGRAFSLDPTKLNAVDNDTAANWCVAAIAYGTAGGYGTPGTGNPPCGVSYCNDASTPRPVVAPAVGTVFVTEVFANPAGADTPAKEWFEVRVTQDCDLNGLKITNGNVYNNTRTWTLAGTDCMHVTSGSYVVIAGSVDPLQNGGLPTTGIYAVSSLSLYNSAGTLTLEAGGQVIDSAAFPNPPEGTSLSLNPANLSASGNDQATAFCSSTTTTVFSGVGTPGQANDTCP
jgi:hypothetical protein